MPSVPSPAPAAAPARVAEQLEFEVGQNGFAIAGIVALTVGVGFMLCLPYAGLPAAVPSSVGLLVAAILFATAHFARAALSILVAYVRGAAMAVMYVSALRLTFPLAHHALDFDSAVARALLVAVVGLNLGIAWRQRSLTVAAVALLSGIVTVVLIAPAWLALGLLIVLVVFSLLLAERERSLALSLAAIVGGYAAYAAWAMRVGSGDRLALQPAFAPVAVLVCAVLHAVSLSRRPLGPDDRLWETVHSLLNCALGYVVFSIHSVASFKAQLGVLHVAAFVTYLGVAMGLWLRRESRIATFFYAMTGYAALSLAILKFTAAPGVYVWLSLESIVVVATAVWFRSRFIVVANFLIYLGIVLVYVLAVSQETGISISFGVVALASARILRWKQHRLELKTDLMRNAYLVSEFVIFPYALAHLVAGRFVALAWIALASAYYVMGLLVRSPRYRWMGHATLGLAMVYVVVVGTSQFEPVYRVLSFLALGTVLLIVSVAFARARRQRAAREVPPAE